MPPRRTPKLLAFAALMTLPLAASATSPFFSEGKPLLDVRLRSEHVDDAGFERDANALTLRTRLGWRSGNVAGFHVLADVDDVRALDESYNSTANGRTSYPAVSDPEGSEWNQAFLGWDSGSGTLVQAGRQRILYDNHRFIGNVIWRQNEQTYDALSVRHQYGDLSLNYAWLDKVHRVFGNNHPIRLQAEQDLDAHLLNATWKGVPGSFTGYAYLIENEDLPLTSIETFGLRHTRTLPISEGREWWYVGEFARQEGWRNAPSNGTVDYLNLEAGMRLSGHGLRLGYELLDGNGQRAFQTPLATLHGFNGWADRFLVTPVNGLEDTHVKFDGPLGPMRYLIALHRFEAARGDQDYGDELNLQLVWPFSARWTAMAKFADYRSDGFGTDIKKFWLSLEYKH